MPGFLVRGVGLGQGFVPLRGPDFAEGEHVELFADLLALRESMDGYGAVAFLLAKGHFLRFEQVNHIRGMGGKKLSEELLKDFDLVISPRECQRMIDTFFEEFWEIPEIYFREIRERVMRDRKLVSNWGREWHCTYDRFDHDLYRRAYSFNPQADCADWLNQWGFKPLHRLLKSANMRSRINLQVHDELIVSCPPEEAYTVALFLVNMLEQPREYFGNQLIVPACVTVARSWKDSEYEFKRLPTKKKFEEAVRYVFEDLRD